jgi:trk system potassium uptake protein TrkH
MSAAAGPAAACSAACPVRGPATPSPPCPPAAFPPATPPWPHFDSLYIDLVIIFSCCWPGSTFPCTTRCLRGKPLAFWRDSGVPVFPGGGAGADAAGVFRHLRSGLRLARGGPALRAFQVVSIVTTTGFATADYEQWPAMSQLILLLCMFHGGIGRFHRRRHEVPAHHAVLQILLQGIVFPDSSPCRHAHVKIAGKAVPDDVMRSVWGFWRFTWGFSALLGLLAGLGVGFHATAFGAVAATLGNIGPGIRHGGAGGELSP